jgi:hypothetical protein
MKISQCYLGAIAASFVITLSVSTAAVGNTKITFDEVTEGTSIDGLNIKGVNFDYKIFGEDSDSGYTVNFGTNSSPLDGNILLVPGVGILTLNFDEAIDSLKFNADWASLCEFDEYCFSPEPDYTVKLFDESLSSWQTFTPSKFFSYEGDRIKQVVFEFNPDRVEEFALDNLTFNKVGNPEPATIFGTLALGSLGLAKLKKLRSRK